MLILLILLLIMIFLRLFIIKEGFVGTPALKPETIDAYNKFLIFYKTFCANWKKAIQSGVALELPQQPLTSPSQFNSASAPSISDDDMNLYITKISQQEQKSFPPTCTTSPTFPTTINTESLTAIINKIPTIEPFINALNWMNLHMEKSQENLKGSLTVEGFDNNDTCQNFSTCVANNPELVKQIATEMSKQNVIESSKLEEILVTKLTPFLTAPALIQALNKNKALLEKSQEIQAKAESGELLNNVTTKSTDVPEIKYTKPAGADKLIDMKKSDPERYKEIEKSHGQWMSIKSLTDQINATL